jgi:hypothetical protein
MSYKIKIYTSNNKNDQLVYNDSKINNLTKINKELINDDILFIVFLEKSLIKNENKRIHTTSLEFIYDKKISEEDFKIFIKNLKTNNFKVLCKNTKIQFIDNKTNEVIYNYIFDSIKQTPIQERIVKMKNKSFYKSHVLFKK